MIIERKWAMPNHQTFKIKPIHKFIIESLSKIENPSLILDPFANRPSDYRAITNDINPHTKTQYHMDAIDFLKMYEDHSVDVVLFDPPYSPRQLKECYHNMGQSLHDAKSSVWAAWKNEVKRVLKQGGLCLSFGWSSVGMSKSRGFTIQRILLVCHGGVHNDTICLSEIKTQTSLKEFSS